MQRVRSLLFLRQFKPTNRASVMFFQPRLQTVRVIDVATRHEHTLVANAYSLAAYCAGRRLHIPIRALFTMLGFNFDDRQLFYAFFFCSLVTGICLGILLRHTSSHLQEISVRIEILLIVVHELVRRETLE